MKIGMHFWKELSVVQRKIRDVRQRKGSKWSKAEMMQLVNENNWDSSYLQNKEDRRWEDYKRNCKK